ncbi:MAG: UDP-N-acetylglucosamine 2-epimerase (non-hydrolyzing) [Planctomycetes bacterium]|nr:UDP-N-acetylglucosamine 2-epimerase (non-hydrolyzing) [Planctomycetota bacterium]
MSLSGREGASIAVVLGTRPEIIKLAPIVDLLGSAARVIYTGQHYDANMSQVFFDEIGMKPPDVCLSIGGRSRASQIGSAVERLAELFEADRPNTVIVQGDTNSTLAGAIAANCLGIPIVHVEAGLRSYDRLMPEEHNRVMTDHIADLLLAPTTIAVEHLRQENIRMPTVETGNTVVESVHRLLPDVTEREHILEVAGLQEGAFFLATFHRPENVDDVDRLGHILQELGGLNKPVVIPLHPRTLDRVTDAGLGSLLNALAVMEPIGYSKFLAFAASAACLISDSGGIQEEASVLRRPIVVVRGSTERPEILGTFGEITNTPSAIGELVSELTTNDRLDTIRNAPIPYGDGTAAAQSVAAIARFL